MNSSLNIGVWWGAHWPVLSFFVGVGQADATETFCRRRHSAKDFR